MHYYLISITLILRRFHYIFHQSLQLLQLLLLSLSSSLSSSLLFKLLIFLPRIIIITQSYYLIFMDLIINIKKNEKREKREKKRIEKRFYYCVFFYYVSLFDFNYTCFTAFSLHLPSITTLIYQLPALFVGHFRTAYSIFIFTPGFTETNQST